MNTIVLRVEWFRWVRTRRLTALVVAFVFFACTSLVGAKYLPDLLRHSAQIQLAHTPGWQDGLQQYAKNAGLLLAAIAAAVSAQACSVRKTDPIGVYYLSRETSATRLYLPRFLMAAAAVGAAALLGAVTAGYECRALFGPIPLGTAAGYLAVQGLAVVLFAQLAAAATACTRSVAIAGTLTAGTYVASLILATAPSIQPYLPTTALQPSISATGISATAAAKSLATLLTLTVITTTAALTAPIRSTHAA
jgi:hypothetical protein